MAEDDPGPLELEALKGALSDMSESLRSLSVKKATDASPKNEAKQLEQLAVLADGLADAIAGYERQQAEERRLGMWLDAMHAKNAPLLEGISDNMRATNELLRASLARLDVVESSIVTRGRSAFQARDEVIAEGEFLAQQLVGNLGTEAGSPLFIEATPVPVPSSIDVLADAIQGVLETSSAAMARERKGW